VFQPLLPTPNSSRLISRHTLLDPLSEVKDVLKSHKSSRDIQVRYSSEVQLNSNTSVNEFDKSKKLVPEQSNATSTVSHRHRNRKIIDCNPKKSVYNKDLVYRVDKKQTQSNELVDDVSTTG